MTTHVVIGPRTRLGTALTEQLVAQQASLLLVARHEQEALALAAASARVVVATEATTEVPATDDLVIHVCALGPVHPVPPAEGETAAFERELDTIDAIVAATTASVRIMLVSSVIALAPTADRRLYGGWKNIAEERLDRLALQHGERVSMSVVYPGRIFSPDDDRGLSDRLSATYPRVAKRLLSEAARAPRRRLVGIDARIWAGLRAMSLVVHVIRPRSTPSLTAAGPATRPPIDERHP